jgi:hypothetical protein
MKDSRVFEANREEREDDGGNTFLRNVHKFEPHSMGGGVIFRDPEIFFPLSLSEFTKVTGHEGVTVVDGVCGGTLYV